VRRSRTAVFGGSRLAHARAWVEAIHPEVV